MGMNKSLGRHQGSHTSLFVGEYLYLERVKKGQKGQREGGVRGNPAKAGKGEGTF